MKITRVLKRETAAVERGEPLMIEIAPRAITIWRKGTREKYSLTYSSLFLAAAQAEADRQRIEKAKRKRQS